MWALRSVKENVLGWLLSEAFSARTLTLMTVIVKVGFFLWCDESVSFNYDENLDVNGRPDAVIS